MLKTPVILGGWVWNNYLKTYDFISAIAWKHFLGAVKMLKTLVILGKIIFNIYMIRWQQLFNRIIHFPRYCFKMMVTLLFECCKNAKYASHFFCECMTRWQHLCKHFIHFSRCWFKITVTLLCECCKNVQYTCHFSVNTWLNDGTYLGASYIAKVMLQNNDYFTFWVL